MNTLKLIRLMAMFAVVFGLAVVESQQAAGATALSTKLKGKVVHGEAMYKSDGNKASFFARVEGAKPRANLLITVRRGLTIKKITHMRADNKGRASVTMDFVAESTILKLQPKDLLEVWQGNELVAAGELVQRK